jgi:hypothetical protein
MYVQAPAPPRTSKHRPPRALATTPVPSHRLEGGSPSRREDPRGGGLGKQMQCIVRGLMTGGGEVPSVAQDTHRGTLSQTHATQPQPTTPPFPRLSLYALHPTPTRHIASTHHTTSPTEHRVPELPPRSRSGAGRGMPSLQRGSQCRFMLWRPSPGPAHSPHTLVHKCTHREPMGQGWVGENGEVGAGAEWEARGKCEGVSSLHWAVHSHGCRRARA